MNSQSLRKAAERLRRGGVVAYATEYCFGLGCDPRDPAAVRRLLRLKRRAIGKGLILIAADESQLAPFVREIPDKVRLSWPGPYTWLLEPGVEAAVWIRGRHDRIAVRVTAHAQAAALCRAAGTAIVSTSANRSGQKPVRSYREALRRFGATVDIVLPGRVGGARAPSEIRDAYSGRLIRG